MHLPKGSILVMERGYTYDAWDNQPNRQDIFFVSRLRKNARYPVTDRRRVIKSKGLTSDQTIELTGTKGGYCTVPPRNITHFSIPDLCQ